MSLRELRRSFGDRCRLVAFLLPVVEQARDERGPLGAAAPEDIPRNRNASATETWGFRSSSRRIGNSNRVSQWCMYLHAVVGAD